MIDEARAKGKHKKGRKAPRGDRFAVVAAQPGVRALLFMAAIVRLFALPLKQQSKSHKKAGPLR